MVSGTQMGTYMSVTCAHRSLLMNLLFSDLWSKSSKFLGVKLAGPVIGACVLCIVHSGIV